MAVNSSRISGKQSKNKGPEKANGRALLGEIMKVKMEMEKETWPERAGKVKDFLVSMTLR